MLSSIGAAVLVATFARSWRAAGAAGIVAGESVRLVMALWRGGQCSTIGSCPEAIAETALLAAAASLATYGLVHIPQAGR